MKVENEFMEFWIENDILFSRFKIKTYIDLEKSKTIIQLRNQISGEKYQYWCNEIKNVNGFSIEARNYANKFGQDNLFACAVIVNSLLTQFIFNVFLKMKKPNIPFKSFSTKEDAVAWLNELKIKNESN